MEHDEPEPQARGEPAGGGRGPARREAGDGGRRGARLPVRFLTAVVCVAVLHWGRELLVPLTLAALISFVLAPLVLRLHRLGLPEPVAVVLTVLVTFALLGGLAFVVSGQLVELASSLPEYRENISARVIALRGTGGDAIREAADMVEDLRDEMENGGEPEEEPISPFQSTVESVLERIDRALDAEGAGLPVRVREPPPSPLNLARAFAGRLLGPAATFGIVLIFVIFFLLQRRDLMDRLIRLAGEGRLDVTTRAMSEAGARISRYLLAHIGVNVAYAVPVTIGLYLIGLPGALLFGLLICVLRFIPYAGPWAAAGLPVLLSLAVFDDWDRPLLVAGLFAGMELFSNNVMEPLAYGSSAGMSTVAVLLAAVFWGWLWGPVGLVLAVPLTVCLVVLGKHVPQLELFPILLGDAGTLPPGLRLYQRALALDEDDALELVEQAVDERDLVGAYDGMLLPALRLEERDRHAGRLAPDRADAVQEVLEAVVGELAPLPPARSSAERVGSDDARPVALCLPARDEADELAARMAAQLLEREGVSARALSVAWLVGEVVAAVSDLRPRVVWICAVPPTALRHARYLCLRLRAERPELRILVVAWGWEEQLDGAAERLRAAGANYVVTSLALGLERTRPMAPAGPTA